MKYLQKKTNSFTNEEKDFRIPIYDIVTLDSKNNIDYINGLNVYVHYTISTYGLYNVVNNSFNISLNCLCMYIDNYERPITATKQITFDPGEHTIRFKFKYNNLNMAYFLLNITIATYVDFRDIKNSSVTSWQQAFDSASNIKVIKGLNKFDNSKTTSTYKMFYNCTGLTSLDLSGLDFSSDTNPSYMFYNCTNLQEINTKNMKAIGFLNMDSMFKQCYVLKSLDVSTWNVTDVTTLQDTFYACYKLSEIKGLKNWSTSNLTSLYRTFWDCKDLEEIDLSDWNVEKVTNLGQTFFETYRVNTINLTNWDLELCTTMWEMFKNSNAVTINLTNFKTPICLSMYSTFESCGRLTSIPGIEALDTNSVNTFYHTFNNASVLTNIDIANWDTHSGLNFLGMFGSTNFVSVGSIGNWNMTNAKYLGGMFSGYWYDPQYLFDEIAKWDITSNCVEISNMFNGFHCSRSNYEVTKVNLTNWNLSNIRSFYAVFHNTCVIREVDMTGCDLRKGYNFTLFLAYNGCKTIRFGLLDNDYLTTTYNNGGNPFNQYAYTWATRDVYFDNYLDTEVWLKILSNDISNEWYIYVHLYNGEIWRKLYHGGEYPKATWELYQAATS